jgi:hypothetical protein
MANGDRDILKAQHLYSLIKCNALGGPHYLFKWKYSYIRLTKVTVNICSFVHQCNTFTSYSLLIVDMFQPHTAIFKCYSILSRSWCSVMPIFACVLLPAMCFCCCCAYCQCPFVRIIMLSLWPPCCLFTSVLLYTWRWPCEAEARRRLIENKKWMCYTDGQKNKYSV